jgi:hypothetical protein
MPLRCVLLAVALGAGAVAPATAAAADITTDRGCYQENSTVTLSGNGFTPGAKFKVLLNGRAISGGDRQVDPTGGVTGSFVPKLPKSGAASRQHGYRVTVQDDTHTATTRFTVTQLYADFRPATGDPATLRVRFRVFGFGLAKEKPSVFLHYVRPSGKLRKTIRLGRAGGACGWIGRTRKMRLFPFRAEHGDWRLQFDTSRAFRLGRTSSNFLFYTLPVEIRPASR